MSEVELKKLWEKHDQLDSSIGDLQTAKELHKQRLDQHDAQFHRINADFGSQVGQLSGKLDTILVSQRTLETDFHERKGAEKANAKQLWLAFSLIGLLFTAINLFLGAK